ncbi:MAG: hypothetical protein ACREV9_04120 [Burkholderiales bacterium]
MTDTVRKVDYFTTEISNKPGEGVRVLKQLREANVNLLAFTAFPSGQQAQVDFVPEKTAALTDAAKQLGLKLSPKKTGFLLEGDDQVGALNDTLEKLAKAGINVTAMDAVATGRRFGAIFWVKPEDVDKAAKAVGAQ